MAVRSNVKFNTAPNANGMSKGARIKITEKERKRFKALVKKAKTLNEVQKLEKAFSEGRLPPGVAEEDVMDET